MLSQVKNIESSSLNMSFDPFCQSLFCTKFLEFVVFSPLFTSIITCWFLPAQSQTTGIKRRHSNATPCDAVKILWFSCLVVARSGSKAALNGWNVHLPSPAHPPCCMAGQNLVSISPKVEFGKRWLRFESLSLFFFFSFFFTNCMHHLVCRRTDRPSDIGVHSSGLSCLLPTPWPPLAPSL